MSSLCGRCFSKLGRAIEHECEQTFNTDEIPCGQCPYLCHSLKSFLVHRKHFCPFTQVLPNFNWPASHSARAQPKSPINNSRPSSSDDDELQCAQGYHRCELCTFIACSRRSLAAHYKQHYSSSSDNSDDDSHAR